MTRPIAIGTQSMQPQERPGPRLVLLATVLATFLAASTVPTPLYGTYSHWWNLSPSSVTIAFGVYAIALLSSLLIFGRVSDYLGRRPVLVAAIVLQVASAMVLLLASNYALLLTGRVVQGIATGLGVGAVSAWILTTDSRRGGVINAAAPLAGSALGGLFAALLVQRLPAISQATYAVLLIVLVAEAVAVWRIDEPRQHREGALQSLRPQAGLPPAARAGFAAAAPVIFAVYALSGLFASLGPSLVQTLSGSSSILLGVMPLVFMNVAAAIASLAVRNRPAMQTLIIGVLGVGVGVAITVCAVLSDGVILLCISAAISGLGLGAGFRGGQQLTLAEVEDDERAGVVSVIYIVSYVGFGIPAIAAGIIDSASGNLRLVALGYCGVLLVLALASGLLLRRATATTRTTS